jgi:hypothetical protein
MFLYQYFDEIEYRSVKLENKEVNLHTINIYKIFLVLISKYCIKILLWRNIALMINKQSEIVKKYKRQKLETSSILLTNLL